MINPIIFDLKYTPYNLPKNATDNERLLHSEERAFYNLTGDKNVLKYIATEGKRTGKKTALEYLQKSTGVFNHNGMISKEELEEMKERAKNNESFLWHGFISLSEEDSPKIDNPEKCIELVKRTFYNFFREAGLSPKNIDLMCALHLDKPHHLHIHFEFWEKEKKSFDKFGKASYRAKGKVGKKAIDNMYVRIAEFLSDDKKGVYEKRVEALKSLREAVSFRNINKGKEEILKAVISLSKDLPTSGRLSYDSKDMEQFRGRVDKIVKMLVDNNGKAKSAELRFIEEIEKKKLLIQEVCKTPQMYGDKSSLGIKADANEQYRYNIDEKNIRLVDDIYYDYKKRQGNLVIKLAKAIKPELYERKKGKKYKANDNRLKRSLSMSSKKIGSLFDNFINSFFSSSQLLERDYTNRLEEIEKEMEEEKKKEANGKR